MYLRPLPPLARIDRAGRRIIEATSARCPICHALQRTHPTCTSCGGLVGIAHERPVDEKGRCSWCQRRTV